MGMKKSVAKLMPLPHYTEVIRSPQPFGTLPLPRSMMINEVNRSPQTPFNSYQSPNSPNPSPRTYSDPGMPGITIHNITNMDIMQQSPPVISIPDNDQLLETPPPMVELD
jgi:hypothetical protein